MFVLANLVNALANLVSLVLTVYLWIIIARALLSWVNPDPFNPIVRFLHRVTEPVLRPIRHRLPTVAMGLDLSPLIVILGIYVLGILGAGPVGSLLSGFLVAELGVHGALAVQGALMLVFVGAAAAGTGIARADGYLRNP